MANPISIPVISRELRVQSRKGATYYTRSVWGLAAGIFLAFVFWANQRIISDGRQMFALMHGALSLMLLVTAPIICADTISRERREGTLGLLMLTPLTPMQIVIGKFLSHFFRLLYFWLMMVPFMMMPMIIGGLTLSDFLLSCATLFALILTGLAAGFVASSGSVSFGAALTASLILGAGLNHFVTTLATNVPYFFMTPSRALGTIPAFVQVFIFGPMLAFAPSVLLDVLQRLFATRYLVELLGGSALFSSLLLLWFAIALSARRVAKHAHTILETGRQQAFRKKYLSPLVAKDFFHRTLKRKLDKNLFAWLEYRTAWARVGIRLALIGLITFELSYLYLNGRSYEFFGLQVPLLFILLFTIALKSSSSFQYEKENGAFELLLVTPIKEPAIVKGRLRAVTRYFLPLAMTLGICELYGLSWRNYLPTTFPDATIRIFSLWLSVLTIPSVGLFFSLRFKTLLPGFGCTVALAIFAAPFFWSCFESLTWYFAHPRNDPWAGKLEEFLQQNWFPALLAVAIYHLALVIVSRHLAINLLRHRRFAFNKS